MALTRITAPPVQPLTEAQVWNDLKLDLSGSPAVPATDEQTRVTELIAAATSYLDGRDGILGRCLVTQAWDLTLDGFPSGGKPIRLPLPPIQSVTSITYTDTNGAAQTLSSSVYALSADRDHRPRIHLAYNQSWPETRSIEDAVTVRFVAGYASGNSPEDASAVPEAIKNAMRLLIGHWFENRQAVTFGAAQEIPLGVRALLAPFMNNILAAR